MNKWYAKAKRFLEYVEIAVYDENEKERASVVTELFYDVEKGLYYYLNRDSDEKNYFDENWTVTEEKE